MRALHLIRVARLSLALVATAAVGIAPANAQTAGPAHFTIVLRGTPIGSEDVTVERTAEGTTIHSTGRFGPPLDIVLRSLRIRYDADDKPLAMTLDASARELSSAIDTVISGATATNTTTPVNGQPVTTSEPVDAAAVLLPNPFVGPYEALAMRLRTAAAGTAIPVYQPRGATIRAEVGASTPQQIQTLNGLVRARQTMVTFNAAGAPPVGLEIWSDENGRLLRVRIPAQQLEFMREDLASVSARIVTMSRPNDEDVRIPANGFSLAGTLSKPTSATGQLPAVLLVSGANQTDRDEIVAGIPIFGQLADALADSGVVVLRYDKRGIGQSGGRSDAATLVDFSDDAKAAVQFLRDRKDIDRRRIAVVGHSEGGWVAMLTAAGNSRVSAVGLLSTSAASGADLNLFQVDRGLQRAGRAETDRLSTLTLQKQIQQAVISGIGWENLRVSAQQRRQAETPYFQSFLSLDPSKLIRRIDQPMLVLQGGLDTQLPPDSATSIESLGKARRKDAGVVVVQIPGVNHLLVPAITGETDEYAALSNRQVSPAVTKAVGDWVMSLKK